jgi:AcrR family transcriptional regulator
MNASYTQAQGRLRDRLREETTRAILEAAEAVFGENGVHAASMERIAARAGVAVGTLYNHFRDRDALLRSLSRSRREALLERLDAALAEVAREGVRARLRAFLAALAAHGQQHVRFLSAMVQAGEGPARARPPHTLVAELVARAERIVADGVAAGDLRPDRAKVFGLAFVGIARGVLVRSLEQEEPEDVTDAVLDLFLEGAAR